MKTAARTAWIMLPVRVRRSASLTLGICCVLGSTAASPANAEPLGRLFFTPEQRVLLERGQQPDSDKPEDIGSLTVNGIVQKHGGERTVWINGMPRSAGKSDERAPESVPVTLPGQTRPARVKVGQRVLLNPHAPQKTEPRTTPPQPDDD